MIDDHVPADDFEELPAGSPRPETRRVFLLAVCFEGGLALVAWLIGWLCNFSPLQSLSWTTAGVLWGIFGTLPLVAGLVLIDRYPLGPFRDLKKVVDDLIVPLFEDFRVWQLGLVALSAGIGEEMLFRGLLQGVLADLMQAWTRPQAAEYGALAVASILFGLMHPITRTYALLCMLVGLYLGGLWIATDNLLVPIIIHAAYDFVALVYLVRTAGNRDYGAAQ